MCVCVQAGVPLQACAHTLLCALHGCPPCVPTRLPGVPSHCAHIAPMQLLPIDDADGDGAPPCSFCSLDKAPEPAGLVGSFAPRKAPCRRCGTIATSLYEMDSSQLLVPDVCMDDFRHVMRRAKGSVGASELVKFTEWTREFGVEGS